MKNTNINNTTNAMNNAMNNRANSATNYAFDYSKTNNMFEKNMTKSNTELMTITSGSGNQLIIDRNRAYEIQANGKKKQIKMAEYMAQAVLHANKQIKTAQLTRELNTPEYVQDRSTSYDFDTKSKVDWLDWNKENRNAAVKLSAFVEQFEHIEIPEYIDVDKDIAISAGYLFNTPNGVMYIDSILNSNKNLKIVKYEWGLLDYVDPTRLADYHTITKTQYISNKIKGLGLDYLQHLVTEMIGLYYKEAALTDDDEVQIALGNMNRPDDIAIHKYVIDVMGIEFEMQVIQKFDGLPNPLTDTIYFVKPVVDLNESNADSDEDL